MKILYVSPEVPALGGAGIASYLGEATRALTAAGHECHVLCWRDDAAAQVRQEPGHTLHVFRRNGTATDPFRGVDDDLRTAKLVEQWVLQLHREHRFDVIEGTDWCAPLCCLLQARRVEPLVRNTLVTVFNHGTTYNIARHQRTFTPREVYQRINLEHQCLRLADVVICPSVAARDSVLEVHEAPAEIVEVIPEPMAWSGPRLNGYAKPSKALYFGSVSASKGAFEFVAVANRLLALYPDFEIEFIGPMHAAGQDTHVFQEGLVRALRASLDRIAFSGAVPRQDALAAIGPEHVLINMSPRETFCYAFAEGIMRGTCPIALRYSAQSELIPAGLRDRYSVGATIADISKSIDEEWLGGFEQHRGEIQDYLKQRTAPAAYAEAYEAMLARSRPRPIAVRKVPRFGSDDVTVLIPAHNPDEYLVETIESVRAQSIPPQKIIIGNDGSDSPASLTLLDKLSTVPEVEIIDFDWRGLAETRNRLLHACKSEIFAFVDADDVLMPRFVETSVDYMSANYDAGVRSVQGWYELFGGQTGTRGPVVYQHFSHSLWNDLKNNHLGVTQVFRDLRYNEHLVGGEAEDWELWLRYFQAGWEVRVIPEVLWRYRRHAGALSSRWSEAMSVGTARANAGVLRSNLSQRRADHVWDFIGEYMYLGETFYNSIGNARSDSPRALAAHKSLSKLHQRLVDFQSRGRPPNFRQQLAIRLMRHLARALK
jgi:glycosyltransferase involved in cell wall biosynthesis